MAAKAKLAFQRVHPLAMAIWIGVPPKFVAPALTDERSMMKAAIFHAHRVTTVSGRYASEITTT